MKSLDQIGIECGTDKNSKGHSYTRYYDMFFAPMRHQAIRLLEIGVYNGDSLRMWAEYFHKGHVMGIDIFPKKEYETERIVTLVRDQSSVEDLLDVTQTFEYDIVVDDGSHQSSHQIISFEVLFKYLQPGGLYCIEDCLCGYSEQWVHNGEKSIIDRIKEMVGEVNMNGKIDLHNLCSDKAKNPERDWTYFEKNIEWIWVGTGLCIIKKVDA